MLRKLLDLDSHGLFDLQSGLPVGQVQQQGEPCRAFDEGPDCTAAAGAEHEIALPMSGNSTIRHLSRSVTDHDHARHMTATVDDPLGASRRASRAQATCQLAPKFAAALDEQ